MELADIADNFVNRCLAKGLTDKALTAAMDAITLWRGIAAEYEVYAQAQDAIVIDAAAVTHLFPPGYYEALHPGIRERLKKMIQQREKQHRQGLREVRAFIAQQVGSSNRGSAAFKEAYEERLKEYLGEPAEPSTLQQNNPADESS